MANKDALDWRAKEFTFTRYTMLGFDIEYIKSIFIEWRLLDWSCHVGVWI